MGINKDRLDKRGVDSIDIGLALAGGGGKGAYEIGVWQALIELGIDTHISVVAGTSVGALNAALFYQNDIELAKNIWFNISHDQLLTSNDVPGDAFFTNDGLTSFIRRVLFSSHAPKNIRCYATCKNANSGELNYFELSHIIDPGYRRKILLASSAMPTIYPMVEIDGIAYTDGGANGDNLPIFPVYENGVSTIIAVHLSQKSLFEASEFRDRWPGVEIIEIIPSKSLGGVLSGTLDFSSHGARRRYDLGYRDAKSQLTGLQKLLHRPSSNPFMSSNTANLKTPRQNSSPISGKIKKEGNKQMEKAVFKNQDLQKQYDERIAMLRQMAQSPALTIEVLWDKTAARYAETIAKAQRLLSEKELESDIPERLGNQLNTFLEKCTNPEFHIALVGAIKAGKSSLINAVLGEELASTEVTPETASLTKFRRSSGKDYILVSFYSANEWKALWESASGVEDSKFMQEYKQLEAEKEKNEWIGHAEIRVECDTKDDLKETIKKWTSSQSATHYFVKEVEVGLHRFDLPEGVVLVDTPGLNDAVAYRSDITKNYIDRANAVLVCVKADKLTGPELHTICGVFSNARYNPEKIYIIATQQDSLNDPIEDWKKQRIAWLGYLKEKMCYGSAMLAEKNLISTSGYLYTLLTNSENLSKKRQFQLYSAAMKLECKPEDIASRFEELRDFTGISALKRKLDSEIVARYRELLLEDIRNNYEVCKETISAAVQRIKANQQEIIDVSQKSLDELETAKQENDAKLAAARQDQEELEELVAEIQKQTSERTQRLTAAIRGLKR